ncbi:MAG: hypothetical protein JWP74_2811 [Marmoricola sp.]|nr:hypothetical protein [Marmoricola sp.]
MRRGFWFVAGAGAGVYVVIKARRAAEAFTPDGMRDRLSGLAVGAQLFADEVRTGMHERETELREQLGYALDRPIEALELTVSQLDDLADGQAESSAPPALEGSH